MAYDTVGRPGVSLDQAAALALHRIESAPVADTAPVLERAGQLWIYQDPALEQRGPVEKLLLRLGAENEHKLQAKAREIRASLSLS